MKISKSLMDKVIRERIYDTRDYRYVYTEFEIIRAPIKDLGFTGCEWETVYKLSPPEEHDREKEG